MPAVFNLSALASGDGSAGFVLNGIDAGDRFGRPVSNAGDVNGDGIDDIVIGALNADPGGDSRAGEGYVIFGIDGPGGASFPASFVLSGLNGTNGFILDGIDINDRTGGPVG